MMENTAGAGKRWGLPVMFLADQIYRNEAEKEKRALWERICRRGLSWEDFRELTGKSEKEVQQINLRLWARGHTDRMNRMISQSGRRKRCLS